MSTYEIAIEKFSPLTIVWPEVDVIPAGSKVKIVLPPVTLDFGPAVKGLLDMHVKADYPAFAYTFDIGEDTAVAKLATVILDPEMQRLLRESWRLVSEEFAKTPLAQEAPRELALAAMLRWMES